MSNLKDNHRSNFIFKVNSNNHDEFKRYCIKEGYNMSDLIDNFISRFIQLKVK